MDLLVYFEQDSDKKFINPVTLRPFKFGDTYHGKRFDHIQHGVPKFLSEEAYQREFERHEQARGPKRTVRSLANKIINNCRARSLKRNGITDISVKRLEQEIVQGNTKYHIEYCIASVNDKTKRSPFVPSLDRISNENPNYIFTDDRSKDTCILVPFGINNLRNDFDDKDMVPLAKAYVQVHSRDLGLVQDAQIQTDS
jgi:hypothetical protein